MKATHVSMILALASVLSLRAEGPTGPWSAGVLLNSAPASLSGDIPGAKGFSLHGGYTIWTPKAGTGFRVTAEAGTLTGWDLQITGKGAKLNHLQVGGELLVSTPFERVKFTLGVNANRWNTSADQTDGSRYDHGIDGLKLGGKVGLEYFHSRNISFRLAFQAVEAGTSSDFLRPGTPNWNKPDEGKFAMTPSWFQFGASWHF